ERTIFALVIIAFVLGLVGWIALSDGATMAKSDFTSTGVPDPVAAQLASYFKDATARLKKVVLHPPGGTQASREFRQAWAANQINKILAGGVIEGRPLDTIRRLKAELEEIHGETVEVNGKNFDVGYYAEMVARTKTRQATVVARHERLGDLGLDLVAIIGRLS